MFTIEITTNADSLESEQNENEPPEFVIGPGKGWGCIDFQELWRYRELLYFLTWRDVKVRYKQTVLGAAWALLQPTLTMIVFTVFFGRLAGIEKQTNGVPYPLFALAGLLPWTFFANTVSASGNSLVGSTNLITKVYFPRLVIPLAAVGAGVVDLGMSLAVMMILMVGYGIGPTWHLLVFPLVLAATILAAAGVGTVLSALTVAYRDFRYVVPFLMQIWMFITPVIYPSNIVPERWRWAFAMNPMAGLIDGFRGAFLGQPLAWASIGISVSTSVFLFLAGAAYFRRVEESFPDVI